MENRVRAAARVNLWALKYTAKKPEGFPPDLPPELTRIEFWQWKIQQLKVLVARGNTPTRSSPSFASALLDPLPAGELD